MIRPGLVSVTFRQLSAAEIVDLARSCGLLGIEWGGDVHVPSGDLATAAKVRALTCEAGLEVVSYGSYYRAGTGACFEEVLSTVQALGAPNVRVWAGNWPSAEADASMRSKIAEDLRNACAAAGRRNVSLEYHAGTLTDTLDSTLRLLGEVGSPNLRTYWQPVPERSHEERLAELAALRPHLSHLHVFQWTRPFTETLRHPLSDGISEWPDCLKAAYGDRFALLEFVPGDDPDLLLREATTLRDWLSLNP